jgi:hypothetical protein
LPRYKAQPGGQIAATLESPSIPDGGNECCRAKRSDPRHSDKAPAGIAACCNELHFTRDRVDGLIEILPPAKSASSSPREHLCRRGRHEGALRLVAKRVHRERSPQPQLRTLQRRKIMCRAILLTVALLLARGLEAQDLGASNVEIKMSKVAGTVYLLQGSGGNIAACVSDDGVVIIDDESAPLADKVKAALQGITDKPVRFVINTHYHGDHMGGNAYFQNKQALILAQDNVRKRLENGGATGNGGSMHFEVKPKPKDALPTVTYDHAVT